jgi:hypothetical protein
MTAAGTVYCAGLPGAMFNWTWQTALEVQSGMLVPPCMDHRMTSELGLTGNPTAEPTRGMGSCTAAPAMDSGR